MRQKLIQHVVSLDGAYDFEEVLYPVGETPWSWMVENARAFSWSRLPGQYLQTGVAPFNPSSQAIPLTGGLYSFCDPNPRGTSSGGIIDALPVREYANLLGAASPYSAPVSWSAIQAAFQNTQIQVSVDGRFQRLPAANYGLWRDSVGASYGYPSYWNYGYRDPAASTYPTIFNTYGRNRWLLCNPVVWFFRDFLWLGGKYRLCEITITEGNEDYEWGYPDGYTRLTLTTLVPRLMAGLPADAYRDLHVGPLTAEQYDRIAYGQDAPNTTGPYHTGDYGGGFDFLTGARGSPEGTDGRYDLNGLFPATWDGTVKYYVVEWTWPVWRLSNVTTGQNWTVGGHRARLKANPSDAVGLVQTLLNFGAGAEVDFFIGPYGLVMGETFTEGPFTPTDFTYNVPNGQYTLEVIEKPKVTLAERTAYGPITETVRELGNLKYHPFNFNAVGVPHEYVYKFVGGTGITDPLFETLYFEDP